MAFEFNGTNQYISASTSPLDGTTPITLCAWGRRDTFNADDVLFGLFGATNGHDLALYWTAGNSMAAYQEGASASDQSLAAADTVATFQHYVGVFTSNSSRTAYKNAIAGTANTTNTGASTVNELTIAATRTGTLPLDGAVCEVAAWSATLTADEITSLSKGFKPYRIRPQSLVFYAPLIRNLQDTKGGLALTNNNTATVADHPRVY